MVVMALPLQMLCEDGVSVNTGSLTVPLTAMLTGTAGLEHKQYSRKGFALWLKVLT